MNLGEIEWLQRNQTVGDRIVQLAVDARALGRDDRALRQFCASKDEPPDEKPILTEETIY